MHRLIEKQGLELREQNLRGGLSRHDTDFFLYNIETFLLVGDVSLDRSKNVPVTDFLLEEMQEIEINNRISVVDQIGCIRPNG